METSTQEKSLMVISEIGNLLRQNSKAIYREIPFDNISLEEKYKSSLNGLSFCRTQSATDMPAKDALALLINVRSSAEWGMQYVLSSRGAIFTRKIADGVFSEWIQV